MSREINNNEEASQQLSCPCGPKGIEMAALMHKTNIGMTREAINALDLADRDIVLELGHGNCAHLEELLRKAKDITYFGLELSETMNKEAKILNQHLTEQYDIHFDRYDGQQLPYSNNTFSKMMTVNTLYFWRDPVRLINELYRVLSDDGILTVAYAQKKFMQQLPFVNDIFRLYDDDDMQELISDSPFRISKIRKKTEHVEGKDGTFVERPFSVAVLKK